MNGFVKDSVHKDSDEKDTLAESNGSNKSKRVDAADRDNNHASSSLANENGNASSSNLVGSNPCEGHGTRCRMTTGRGDDHPKLLNGVVNCGSDISGSKRKSEESCILIAQDVQSQEKVEELKKTLEKEAILVLQSCGWYEKVYSFMCSRKRLCIPEAVNTPCGMDLKKKLIADAKPTFISQIPESLKEDLIKHIRSFSKEKQEFLGQ
ncbi:hypothetical protein LWI29_009552 [Acer saccharum]|uniref:Uncharacterized protein n=1 Tax=Acer saccharum TaxID=4024 RepID=A0AA39W174_ACESA|nr:hypothetical protein LWI29_009552 [Acer saccharum]